jgi:hypothetical protein
MEMLGFAWHHHSLMPLPEPLQHLIECILLLH